MPRIVKPKKSKAKVASVDVVETHVAETAPAEATPAVETPVANGGSAAETAAAEPPYTEPAPELQPPSTPVEPVMEDARESRAEERRGYQRDKIATSLNIAKLQAMSMTELNGMARELGVENFGTMR